MSKEINEVLDLVREAIDQLRRGDAVDALTTLERCAFPKWDNSIECRFDYELAMFPPEDGSAAAFGAALGAAWGKMLDEEAALSGAAA